MKKLFLFLISLFICNLAFSEVLFDWSTPDFYIYYNQEPVSVIGLYPDKKSVSFSLSDIYNIFDIYIKVLEDKIEPYKIEKDVKFYKINKSLIIKDKLEIFTSDHIYIWKNKNSIGFNDLPTTQYYALATKLSFYLEGGNKMKEVLSNLEFKYFEQLNLKKYKYYKPEEEKNSSDL